MSNAQLATVEHLGQGEAIHDTITDDQNDYRLDEKYNIHRLTVSGSYVFSGFSGWRPGGRAVLYNAGSQSITITHEDTDSLAQNRVICPGGTTYTLAVGEAVAMTYADRTNRWLLGV